MLKNAPYPPQCSLEQMCMMLPLAQSTYSAFFLFRYFQQKSKHDLPTQSIAARQPVFHIQTQYHHFYPNQSPTHDQLPTTSHPLPPTNYQLLIFFFFIVCLNFKTAKFSSIEVSASVVCKSSSKILAINSPLLCIRFCCSALSLILERVLILRDSSLI